MRFETFMEVAPILHSIHVKSVEVSRGPQRTFASGSDAATRPVIAAIRTKCSISKGSSDRFPVKTDANGGIVVDIDVK